MLTWRLHTMHVPGVDPARDALVEQHRAAGSCVHEDPTRRGVMATFLSAVRCALVGPFATWTVILQDDAVPLPGWDQHLPRALAYSPAPVLSLFHIGGPGRRAAEAGYAYFAGRNNVWGVAAAYHRTVLAGILDASRLVPGYHHDDRLVGAYMAVSGQLTAGTSRALFDHAPVRSLLGHGGPPRAPQCTIRNPGPSWSAPGYHKHSPGFSLDARTVRDTLADHLTGEGVNGRQR